MAKGWALPSFVFPLNPIYFLEVKVVKLRQHRNVQTSLREAALGQGPLGSVPKNRPRARCRPSATLSLVWRHWCGALADFHMKISPCKNVNLCLGQEKGEEIVLQ